MRVVRWKSERLVDALLELFRQRVLEPFRLAVHLFHVDAERLREVELEQPVVPDDFQRHFLAGACERDSAVGLVHCELERSELFHHRAGRGGRDALPLGQRGH